MGSFLAVILWDMVDFKTAVFRTVLQPHSSARSSLMDANAIHLSQKIAQNVDELTSPDHPCTVYWMNWGAIQSANNEILFRRVPFLEGFEFDYSYRELDVLSPEFLKNALLVYPDPPWDDIFHVEDSLQSPPYWSPPGFRVWHTGTGHGAALVGTGWLPPVPYGDEFTRYLRDTYDGGLFIWSSEPRTVLLRMNAFKAPNPPEPILLSIRYGDLREEIEWPEALRLQPSETVEAFFQRLQKTSHLDLLVNDLHQHWERFKINQMDDLKQYPELIDFLRRQPDFNAYFNQALIQSPLFKNLVRYYYDNGNPVPPSIAETITANELRFPISDWQAEEAAPLYFAVQLDQGNNVLKLTIRNLQGARSGMDPFTGRVYEQNGKLAWIIFDNIQIAPTQAQLEFTNHLAPLSEDQYYALAEGISRPQIQAVTGETTAGTPVNVSWRGIESPQSDDWVGLFPVHGNDQSRLAFVFTGGGSEGNLAFPLPQEMASGEYELRLFSHGNWKLLARSEPFRIVPKPSN